VCPEPLVYPENLAYLDYHHFLEAPDFLLY
jgi:hypothetical protein